MCRPRRAKLCRIAADVLRVPRPCPNFQSAMRSSLRPGAVPPERASRRLVRSLRPKRGGDPTLIQSTKLNGTCLCAYPKDILTDAPRLPLRSQPSLGEVRARSPASTSRMRPGQKTYRCHIFIHRTSKLESLGSSLLKRDKE